MRNSLEMKINKVLQVYSIREMNQEERNDFPDEHIDESEDRHLWRVEPRPEYEDYDFEAIQACRTYKGIIDLLFYTL